MEQFPSKVEDCVPEPGRLRKLDMWSTAYALGTLHKERQRNIIPVQIIGFLSFENEIPVEEFRQLIRSRLCAIPCFRSKVTSPNQDKNYYFEELNIEDIDMTYHLNVVEQRNPWSTSDLYEFASDCAGRDMDPERPLWQFHVIQKFEDGSSVLVFHVNHALGDGSSLVAVLTQAIMDPPATKTTETTDGSMHIAKGLTPPRRQHTLGLLDKLWAFVLGSFKGLFASLLPGDQYSKLKLRDHRSPSLAKKFSFSESYRLRRVKDIAKAFPGASVNDVILALVTRVAQRYYEENNDPILEKNCGITSGFIIDLRKPNSKILTEENFGNVTGVANLSLPIHKPVTDLIPEIQRQTNLIRASPEIAIQNFVLRQVVKYVPVHTMGDAILDNVGRITTMVSNVRGPAKLVSIGGRTVTKMRFNGLSALGAAMGVLTYNGQIMLNIATDPQCEENPAEFTKHFEPALRDLEISLGIAGSEVANT